MYFVILLGGFKFILMDRHAYKNHYLDILALAQPTHPPMKAAKLKPHQIKHRSVTLFLFSGPFFIITSVSTWWGVLCVICIVLYLCGLACSQSTLDKDCPQTKTYGPSNWSLVSSKETYYMLLSSFISLHQEVP